MLTDPERTPAPVAASAATAQEPLPSRTWTAQVVADSDTRWKWGAALAHRLRADGRIEVHGSLLHGRATPNAQQVADVGADAASLRRVGIAELIADLAHTDADVVVLSCVGGTIQSLMQGLSRVWAGRTSRPVVVTGYVGLVYEKVIDGLLLRAGADVLLANSRHDEREFRQSLAAVGADPDTIVRTALPFLGGVTYDASAAGTTRPFTLTVVAQPSVPETLAERRYLVRQTVEHARRHPDRHVILKLRGRKGEQTTHVERYHLAGLLAKEPAAPRNLEVAYGSMSDVLDRTDICVTVSSTAALESLHRGIPTGILTDFGVRELLGNHAFLHSGMFTSFPALHAGAVPQGDPEWAADNGVNDPEPYTGARSRVAELVADRDTLPPLRPWFDLDDAGGYLPSLLERNGLKPDGSPLKDGAYARETPVRRVAKGVARRGYLFALEKAEPTIRKWAQL